MQSLLFVVALGLGLSALADSAEQSLAEVSRNTEASRNATPGRPAAKVYTNQDLAGVAQSPPSTSTNSSARAPAAPSTAPSTPSDDKAPADTKGEAYWRDRMQPLRERLDDVRALADSTKRRAETLMRSAERRCFTVGVVCADYTESLRLTDEHRWLVVDVARAERAVSALEEEARRAGVPPGWLRE